MLGVGLVLTVVVTFAALRLSERKELRQMTPAEEAKFEVSSGTEIVADARAYIVENAG